MIILCAHESEVILNAELGKFWGWQEKLGDGKIILHVTHDGE